MKNEKSAEINRENQILLNKLVEISNGKWTSVAKAPKVAKKKEVGNKRSLNYERRKKEFERIERENMAIAQRLFNKQGSISKKKMDQDYGVHKKYKKQIQKLDHKKGKRGTKAGKGLQDDDQKEEEDEEKDAEEEPETNVKETDDVTEDDMGDEQKGVAQDKEEVAPPKQEDKPAKDDEKGEEKVDDEKANTKEEENNDAKPDDVSADGEVV